VLAACDTVLVDENEAHGAQTELLDARGNGRHCSRLLLGIETVPFDETGGSEAETQTVAHGANSCRRRGRNRAGSRFSSEPAGKTSRGF